MRPENGASVGGFSNYGNYDGPGLAQLVRSVEAYARSIQTNHRAGRAPVYAG
ncbi:MAG: hypothetical protein O7F73_12385 [Gammaproteobacteria bacterium]|nr:hypothetical protein [Gammaproteobacteria bacterium]